jgi:hypothetical protein
VSFSGYVANAAGTPLVEFVSFTGELGNGPGSSSFSTPATAATATVTIIKKKGLPPTGRVATRSGDGYGTPTASRTVGCSERDVAR